MKSRSIFLYRELKKKSSILSEERKQYLKKLIQKVLKNSVMNIP